MRGDLRRGIGANEGTALEWFFSAAVVAAGSTLFGHFEEGTPKVRRLSRWLGYLGVVALLSKTGGMFARARGRAHRANE